MRTKKNGYASIALLGCLAAGAAEPPGVAPSPSVQNDGTITTPSFELPFSSFASPESMQSFVSRLRNPMPIVPDIGKIRELTNERVAPLLERAKTLFPCTSTKSVLGGVPVEIFVPMAGISPENKNRVLIELHGGGFV